MTRSVGSEVAAALGLLLQRSFRARIYQGLTDGVATGLDETTYPVLSGLERAGPRTAADLAVVVGLDRSGVSRRASRLERAGLLSRQPDPNDARAVLLTLTDEGRDAIAATRRRLVARIDASMESWPKGQAQAFAKGLRLFVESDPFS